MTVSTGLDACL